MSLVECVLSSLVSAIFLPAALGALLSSGRLLKEAAAVEGRTRADDFVFRSFSSVSREEDFGEWEGLCSALHPDVTLEFRKVGVRDGEVLFVCEWNGKKVYSKIADSKIGGN